MTAQSDIVASAICDEGGQKIERHVTLMKFTPENLRLLWDKSQHYHNIFGFEVEGNFDRFASLMFRSEGADIQPTGLFWVVDDFVGVFYLTRIIPNVDALVHYIFFDKKHRGREPLIMAMIRYGFETFQLNRMSVELPTYASEHAKFLVEHRLGFQKEGVRRQASQNKFGWHNVLCYGILKSEAFPTQEVNTNGKQV